MLHVWQDWALCQGLHTGKPVEPECPKDFTPLIHLHGVDEWVYPAKYARTEDAPVEKTAASGGQEHAPKDDIMSPEETHQTDAAPSIRDVPRRTAGPPPFLSRMNVPSKNGRLLLFDGLIQGSPATVMVDTGATRSFASAEWCEAVGLSMVAIDAHHVRLANGSEQSIPGVVPKAHIKIGKIKTRIDLLVTDLDGFDVVLGTDWMEMYNGLPDPAGRKLVANGQTAHAMAEEIIPESISEYIELCSATAFRRYVHKRRDNVEILVAMVTERDIESTPAVPSSLASQSPEHAKLEAQIRAKYADILVDEIPPGLPKKRTLDGREIVFELDTAPDAKPFARAPYRPTVKESEEITKQIQDLLARGWIRPSLSAWAAPVLFVPKKSTDGVTKWRMCVDYRGLNKQTIRTAFPMPRVDELLERVDGAIFSKLDLAQGYHQIRMKEEDVPKTAFVTPQGQFEFLVMTFGFAGAPSTFSFMMNSILKGLSFVAVYLDDILIFSKTAEEHTRHVSQVMDRLVAEKLYCRPSKCEFYRTEVEYLGHVVYADGTRVEQSKVDAVQRWELPANASDLRSFLGLAGYYRNFCPLFSDVAAPLTALTGKAPWVWTRACTAAFEKLKLLLCTAPTLIRPDLFKPFVVMTDASDYGIGAVLQQDQGKGLQPICYMSHKLNSAERNYPVHERELLAIVVALRTWRHLLQDARFAVEVQTDHKALVYFHTQPGMSPRQVRWQNFLADYELKIEYLKGSENVVADALSRKTNLRLNAIRLMADYDPLLKRVRNAYAADPDVVRRMKQAAGPASEGNFRNLHGMLYYVQDGKLRMYVPDDEVLRKELIRDYHEPAFAGHFGAEKTYASIKQWYYWPKMREQVYEFCKTCMSCQLNKPTACPPVMAVPLEVPDSPWRHISMDWVTELPRSYEGHDAILNVVDRFTKWAIVIPCNKTQSAVQMATALFQHVFGVFGIPESIVSDKDTRLTADFTKELWKLFEIHAKKSLPYRPQTDGSTERFNRTFLERLRHFVNRSQRNWEQRIPALMFSYHNAEHKATGFTPHFLQFGRVPRDPRASAEMVNLANGKDVKQWLSELYASFHDATVSMQKQADAMIRQGPDREHVYAPGDLVKITTTHLHLALPSTQTAKLQQRFVGPFTVLSKHKRAPVYEVRMPPQYRGMRTTFNAHDLRPWFPDERHPAYVYPLIEPHPTDVCVVEVADRKPRRGRNANGCSPAEHKAQYLVAYRSNPDLLSWVNDTVLRDIMYGDYLIEKFELMYPRSAEQPCNPVKDYEVRYNDRGRERRVTRAMQALEDGGGDKSSRTSTAPSEEGWPAEDSDSEDAVSFDSEFRLHGGQLTSL